MQGETRGGAAFARLRDYERRSLEHAPGSPLQVGGGGWRGLAWRLGHRHLVSTFDDVVEILGVPAVTPLPGTQPWLLGLANIRGNLLPVLDLRLFLEGHRSVSQDGQRMLVMRQPGGDVGILIDELFGQRVFDDEQRTESGDLAEGRYGHFIERAYRQNEQSWGVFSLGKLARTPEFRQAAA